MFSVVMIGAAMAAAPQSSQAAFDAATKAAEAGQCVEAIAAFDRIAAGPAAKNRIVAAAIAVRRGQCLRRLGRHEEAEWSIRSGIAILESNSETFRLEVRDAYLGLAQISTAALAYDQALVDANKALALSEGATQIIPLQLRSRLTQFDGDGAAIRDAEAALALLPATASKSDLATAQLFIGRAMLAGGRVADGQAMLKRALANNGGLTLRANLSDIATRYDLAQAALLNKKPEAAQEYLVYTGAGRISEAPFASAKSIEVPTCGTVPGLTPDSYAVIEFSLNDAGSIESAQPVFAQGGREAALSYARAVREWSWAPDDARKIPVFYRALTRVEVRCSRAGETTDLQLPLAQAVDAWLEDKGAPAQSAKIGAAALPGLRQAAAGGDAAALSANLALAGSWLVGEAERLAAAKRAIDLASSLSAPTPVRTHAALMVVNARTWTSGSGDADRLAELEALSSDAGMADDALSRATLQLRIAELRRRMAGKRAPDPALEVAFGAVAEMPGLPQGHPLKVRAMLDLANAAAARGDFEAAQKAFARTGLDEQQCALVGPKPDVRRQGATTDLYPSDLIRQGFTGWTRVEYDIAADGRTADPRTILSYPPFLFGDVAKRMVAATRYAPSYRPASGLACAANVSNFVFQLPS